MEEVHLLQQEAPAGLEAAEAAGRCGRTQRVDARRARQTQCARHVQRIADDDGAVQVFAPELADGRWVAFATTPGRAIGNMRQPNQLSTLLLWAAAAAVWPATARK